MGNLPPLMPAAKKNIKEIQTNKSWGRNWPMYHIKLLVLINHPEKEKNNNMGLPAPETPQDVSTQQDEQTPEIEHGYPKSPFKEVTFSKPTNL